MTDKEKDPGEIEAELEEMKEELDDLLTKTESLKTARDEDEA